MQEGVEEIQR